MQVSDVIKVPTLEGCTIIAGESGLNREVLYVNMMDAPDIAQYLKPNELLVTTAYHLKDQPALLEELVQQMHEQGCAALGIKTKRFLSEIPKQVIQLARQCSFPIIEIPMQSSLGDIVNQILSKILDKRTNELISAIDVHRQFSEQIMSGKGIDKLLTSLSNMVNDPVILLDQYSKPIAASIYNRQANTIVENLYVKDIVASFPDTSFFSFSTIHDQQTYSVFMVYTHNKKAGYLLILGEIFPGDHATMLTIEQATNVISFALMKENALTQYSRRVKNEFFYNFTEGLFTSDEEIMNRAKEFSVDTSKHYICAAGKMEGMDRMFGSYTQNQLEMDEIYQYIEEELVSLSLSTHLFTRGDMCIFLFGKTDYDLEIISSLEIIQEKVELRFDQTLSFGVGNLVRDFLHVKDSFKEAMDALETGRLAGKKGFIQSYKTKDVLELIRIMPKEDLLEFYDNVLHPLVTDQEDDTLLHTIFVYLEAHCQISETAKRLFVHRNTVVYRLEKCEELLGRSLSDPDTSLQIRLALRIKKVLGI
ncbi:PucR family transcriptional regulator [Gracilibacillus caseinilyticus]|uniref:PucR family transcriptional regulator n=1 Tax=Gracilibacillus caseinilyticus TaxID=2932256 RepID=A0ABY4F081_9BACI|nr:PucR family transcriptional regulator [Gracilibacillus caseinilyticus]UOQ49918.1 PucR family transcriptional regulator [Gracilibacillus caseinilyticus]